MKILLIPIMALMAACGTTPEQFDALVNQPESFGCLRGDFHGTYTNSNLSGGRLRVPERFYTDAKGMKPEQLEALVRGLVPVLCP